MIPLYMLSAIMEMIVFFGNINIYLEMDQEIMDHG